MNKQLNALGQSIIANLIPLGIFLIVFFIDHERRASWFYILLFFQLLSTIVQIVIALSLIIAGNADKATGFGILLGLFIFYCSATVIIYFAGTVHNMLSVLKLK
jgi:hypothetical protein